MKKSRHRWSTGFTVGLFMGLVLACSGISQAEFECEDAVSHLQKCCQGLTASNINCIHEAVSGCDSYSNNPDFDTVQSQCILNEPCDELVSTGVCERVIAIPPNDGETGSYQDPSTADTITVCP
jgi:hypothetical protein